jgi:hypothetical protein
MNLVLCAVLIGALFPMRGFAKQQAATMDDEPHYSRVFSNDYCRAYLVSLGRLEETKPVLHEHDWVRMTLSGVAEQAWDGTLYSSKGYEDPEGYIISFLFPAKHLSLRNPHNDSYRAMIVEIMKADDSRNRVNDPSLSHFGQTVGPGVDPHVSYVNSLTKTSVEIMNVQLLGGDSNELHSPGAGALIVAITDADVSVQPQGGDAKEMNLAKGDVQWVPGAAPAVKNLGKDTARLAVLEMK